MTTILWMRRELRLADHVALQMASRERGPLIPLFCHTGPPADEAAPGEDGWPLGAGARWWLHHSLEHLDARLRGAGSRLVLRHGDPVEAIADLVEATGATSVRTTHAHTPTGREDLDRLAARLGEDVRFSAHAGRILHDPEAIETTSGGPYHVFTPFHTKLKRELDVGRALGAPDTLAPPPDDVESLDLAMLELPPEPTAAEGFTEAWTPGEAGAQARLASFIEEDLAGYAEHRDRPDLDATSRLSPHLAFGEVSPRQVHHAVGDAVAADQVPEDAAHAFLRQLAWREFGYHLLHHHPTTPTEPLRDKHAAMRWREDDAALERWQQGRTGYPFVDAGMRQLEATGWMHNRVRMITASFLTKDLLLPWQAGARWFWQQLVDADLANNTLGWQWVAGSGADAQPFFRVFNPVTQGERYDPEGDYVRRWVPELADLPSEHVHAPWQAPKAALLEAGVVLGEDYPAPIVDHAAARQRALAAYEAIG